jgi:hypothetical protein
MRHDRFITAAAAALTLPATLRGVQGRMIIRARVVVDRL